MPKEKAAAGPSAYERIYSAARRIPAGRVATYGQIARTAGRCSARMVGYAMAALPRGSDVPWHRIINGQGRISLRGQGGGARQRELLEAEGVVFDERGRIDLKIFSWPGPRGDEIDLALKID